MEAQISYANGMNLGLGYNSGSHDLHPSPALEPVDIFRDVPGADGQEVLFKVELVSSTESIMEKLNVSASASLKYGMTGSGSATASFASQFQQNSYTIYIIVHVIVTNKQKLLDLSQISFKPSAVKLYREAPNEFLKQYGDSFIYGLITGGEFMGVLEIETTTASELKEIKAKLSGEGSSGMWSGSASGSFEKAMEKVISSYHMKATVFRQGGVGKLNVIKADQLVQGALDFPSVVAAENAFPRSVLIIPYNHIPIPNLEEDGVLTLASMQSERLQELGKLHHKAIRFQNDMIYALENAEKFPDIKIDKIKERMNKVNDVIKIIEKSALCCFNDFNKCSEVTIDPAVLINDDIIPEQIEQMSNLGTMWLEEETGWIGIWKRRGLSNIFDATWSKAVENDFHSILTIHREGNEVYIVRKDNGDGDKTSFTYRGTVTAGTDTQTVVGDFFGANGTTHKWKASITS